MTELTTNPETDLVLTREVDVPRHLVWKAWTVPEHLEQWFCPRPYGARVVRMDVRPGGAFEVQILDPEGKVLESGPGCYLDVVENTRLIWTSALGAGYRPVPPPVPVEGGVDCAFVFTAAITLESLGKDATRYTAHVMHADAASAKKHEAMGFRDGWGTALDQLVELVKSRLS